MPESEIFIVRCGRPIWPSHAGLSENSRVAVFLRSIFTFVVAGSVNYDPAMLVYPKIARK